MEWLDLKYKKFNTIIANLDIQKIKDSLLKYNSVI